MASENCKILSLKMSELHRLAEKYPEIQRELVEVEQAREEKNKESLQLAREKNLKSAVLPYFPKYVNTNVFIVYQQMKKEYIMTNISLLK